MYTQVNNEKEDSTDQVSPLLLHLNQGEPIRYIVRCVLINVNKKKAPSWERDGVTPEIIRRIINTRPKPIKSYEITLIIK